MVNEEYSELCEASGAEYSTQDSTKFCNGCESTKDKSEFGKSSRFKDGLRNRCRQCRAKEHLKRREKHCAYQKEYRSANKESIREGKRRCVEAKRALYLEKKRAYYQDNKEMILSQMKEYRQCNREAIREGYLDWYSRRSHVVKSNTAKRRALLLNATPRWLTDVHYNQIRVLYKISVALEAVHSVKYHVDHIVPLQGKTVCGLHVPWNLQIITAEENLSKGNKFNG